NAPPISPADAFDGYGGIGDYRHSNGNIWDVLRAGHAMRDGAFERRLATAIDTGEIYDLVAVGGGISGLAAAIFFQKYLGGGALVIDNHPIFGGEAKRNEFLVDGQRLTAHQGSAIFLVPQPGGYTDRFYAMIGMDRSSFTYQTWRGPAPELPLSHSPYETVRRFLSPVEGGGYGLGPDVLSAYCHYAIETQFPEDGDDTLGDQMFPDGNGGFARLMVKTLIPDAFAGPRTVDAVWQNRVNF